MDKKTLKQYRPLKRESEMIDKKLDRLKEKAIDVPIVCGKVKGSSREFPYIETHMTVIMDEPKRSDSIARQRIINQKRKERVNKIMIEIEEFIAGIPDSIDRQIFELIFLRGKKQKDVADQVGLERSSISKRIDRYLQLSHNSQK